MSKKKREKIFVPATHFEITLTNEHKEVLTPVAKWLLKIGNCEFQWGWKLLERDEEFSLSIQMPWADNLVHIGKLLGDYKQD